MSDEWTRADRDWLKRANSPRREAELWIPSDEIEARSSYLWWEDPHTCVNDDGTPVRADDVASWPAQRRAILHETHPKVMASTARYGVPLP